MSHLPEAHVLLILLASAGAAGGLLLAGRLASSAHATRRDAHLILSLTVTAMVLLTVGDLLDRSHLILRWPHLELAFDWLIFAIGPLLLVYVRLATGDPPRDRASMALHFVPAALALIASFPVFLLSADAKRASIGEDLALATSAADPVLAGAAVHVLIYLALALRTHALFRQRLRQTHSSVEAIEMGWLRATLLLALACWLALAAFLAQPTPLTDAFNVIAAPMSLYVLAFVAFVRRDDVATTPVVEATPDDRAGRYRRSGLTTNRAIELHERLERLMESDKPWLENDLTLQALATRSDMSPHHLSQVLNDYVGSSFFDFVNKYRVREVQRCVVDPAYRSQSLLEIALASGFNSKTAFNEAFRKHAGCTPSAWRNQASAARRPA